jgi:hypothetical protein
VSRAAYDYAAIWRRWSVGDRMMFGGAMLAAVILAIHIVARLTQ